ncbi:MAG: ribosome small subunit-dependent GTPase A [Wenzhouxiangella sp.]|jgi:ribosome biogenesis GTPase|nr:ribosome small subunit-dependent GTPase A [Wenzhouxiangella sp.]
MAATIPAQAVALSHPGLVVRAWANRGIAQLDSGQLVPFHFPRRLTRPLPGDRVILDNKDSLVEVIDRHNEFGRGDARGRFKPTAANIDLAIIVIAPRPAPSPDLIHRYITGALLQQIEPVIVVNKADLPIPSTRVFEDLQELSSIGYRIIHTRCKPEPDLGDLSHLLNQGTSLLTGQSGVGKTSLLNAIVPDLDEQTGALSHVTGKGTHTTTTATVYPLSASSAIVDTPGVWEYSLWSMPADELQRGFPEFAPFASKCRFRNCRHDSEPGCAVRAAAESSEIPASRHAAWLRLLKEQDRLERG